MTAAILDGSSLSAVIFSTLQEKIKQIPDSAIKPQLVIVQVLGDAPSAVYIKRKLIAAEKIGLQAQHIIFPHDVSSVEIEYTLLKLNQDLSVHGILLQLPLPKTLSAEYLLNLIDPQKDVDGLTAHNLGCLVQKQPQLKPCTAHGIIRLLQHYELELVGKEVVIINASKLVGRPLAMEFLTAGSTVTICHSRTKNLAQHVSRADIVISAIGIAHQIPTDWLSPGVVVVDVGMNRSADGNLVGDFDFATARQVASWITPVPGGVGPMTVALLMENVWQAYTHRSKLAG